MVPSKKVDMALKTAVMRGKNKVKMMIRGGSNNVRIKMLLGLLLVAIAWSVVDEFYLMRKLNTNRLGLIPDEIKAAAMIMGLPISPACEGKERFLELLRNAGLPASNLTTTLCEALPSKSQVNQLYGQKAVVHGMDTCEAFRNELNGRDPVLRVTGLYNTGTNALAQALYHHFPRPKQIRQKPAMDNYFQVPWNKHFPIQAYRDWKNHTSSATSPPATPILTLVLIRDPFRWMAAMCKANYRVHWMRAPAHCPNLVVTPSERKRPRYRNVTRFDVTVAYGDDYVEQHKSLADFWSSWNQAYLDEPKMHRLVLRMEDLLFRPDDVMDIIANCTGQLDQLKKPFSHQLGRSKEHGQSTDLIQSMSRYGTLKGRDKGLRPKDIHYAWKALNPALMHEFHYPRVRL